jgi:hypothetical protein
LTESKIEKWFDWIDGPIKTAVITLHHRRQIWRGLAKVVQERSTPLPDSAYWQYHLDLYAGTQAIAIRRQTDRGRDVVSLARLLTEIEENASRITLDWWVGLWSDPGDEPFARRIWADKYGASELDPIVPRSDLEALRDASAEAKAYVNKNLAHAIPAAVPAEEAVLTLDGIDHAMDVIGTTFQKYLHLLTAADMIFLEPVIQHDWLAPFRTRWIESQPEPRLLKP